MARTDAVPVADWRWWDSLVSEMPAALPADARADWHALAKREARALERQRAQEERETVDRVARGLLPLAGKAGDPQARAAQVANAAHTGMRDALRVTLPESMDEAAAWERPRWERGQWRAAELHVLRAGWPEYSHGSDDERIRDHAQKLARWFEVKYSRVKVGLEVTGDAVWLDALRAEGDTLADLHGVDRARSPEGDARAIVARYCCPRWWRRKLRQAQRLAIEREKIAQGLVGAYKQVYCSDVQVRLRAAQLYRNREMMEVVKVVNDEGQEYTLQEVSDLSVSNPKVKRPELMVRMRGFEEYADSRGHVAFAVALTAPSRMHPNDAEYDGTTAREVAAHMSAAWARFRSSMARKGIHLYGFRVAEPHKDGTTHWHAVLFFESDAAALVAGYTLRNYFLGEFHPENVDRLEAGSNKRRCVFERVRENATGYLAKYITKGIDGWYSGESHDLFDGMGEGVGFMVRDDDAQTGERVVLGRSVDLAKRVQAWASCYRIRQFQQIGGPPVTLWREARRVDGFLRDWENPVDAGPVQSKFAEVARIDGRYKGFREALRAAADESSWFGFCDVWARWHAFPRVALGSTPNVPRRWMLARPVYWCADRLAAGERVERTRTQYGDLRAGQVCGFTLAGLFVATRLREWRVEFSGRLFERRVAAALGSALDFQAGANGARPWRTVNNCTVPAVVERAQRAIERMYRRAIVAGDLAPGPS